VVKGQTTRGSGRLRAVSTIVQDASDLVEAATKLLRGLTALAVAAGVFAISVAALEKLIV